MPENQKPTRRSPAGGKAKAVAASLAVVALERLGDPKVRAQLADQARAAAERAKAWRAERGHDAPSGHDAPRHPTMGPLGDRLRQRQLVRRVKSLQASVGELTDGRPEIAELLAAPTATLHEISSGLRVAGELPRAKQQQAHAQISHELDQLEATVFDAAMPHPD